MVIEYKSLKAKIDKDGYFEGYANVFGIVDEQNDKVIKGAFASSIKKYKSQNNYPNMYFNHDLTMPIGSWIKMEEDDYGLYVIGKLVFAMPMAAAVEAMMHRMSVGLSVGMKILKSGVRDGVRHIYDVDLHEISVTRRPANQKARCFIKGER